MEIYIKLWSFDNFWIHTYILYLHHCFCAYHFNKLEFYLCAVPPRWSFTKSRCIWSASIKSLEQPVEGGDELLNSHWELLFCILPLCSAMLSEDLLSHWRSGTVAALMDDYSILIAKWNIKVWFLFGKYNWNFRNWTLGTVVGKPNFCPWGQSLRVIRMNSHICLK